MRTPESEQTILIASCSVDNLTWEPVAVDLTQRGHSLVVFEADKVALGAVPFKTEVNNEGFGVWYGEDRLCLQAIGAAWYRRPAFVTNPQKNGAAQSGVDVERRMLQAALWDEVPKSSWLNAPDQISIAERKVSQLNAAQKVGFQIPYTVITNDWEEISDNLPEEIICKASRSLYFDGEEYRLLYTTSFLNVPDKLPLDRNPFPGIWQESLAKAREWRITAVGEETFDAAIYTSDDAKDDWRKHQNYGSKVEFRSEPFPDEQKEKCLAFLEAMDLKFGAFDFIEQPDGTITFLECNPNGQFRWIEDQLGLPISAAIADELIDIAKKTESKL